MEEDLGTAASAVGRYQVAWAFGCRSYYSFGRRHNNDEIILTRNDTANVYACRDSASLQRDARQHHKAGLNAQPRLLLSSSADLPPTEALCRFRADTISLCLRRE